MPIRRVLVTGSRNWDHETSISRRLWLLYSAVPPGSSLTVVHGACRTGADSIAHDWARQNQVHVEPHPADWSKGAGAGPIRNRYMVSLGADLCLAFPRGVSRGTRGCERLARGVGIPTYVLEYEQRDIWPPEWWLSPFQRNLPD